MGRRLLVLCVAAAGCIEIPPPAGVTCEPGEDDDRDGWRCDGVAPDCDDGDPAIHPGARDVVDDGVDQDCFEGDLSSGLAVAPVSVDATDRVVTMRRYQVVFPDAPAAFPEAVLERATGKQVTYGPGVNSGLGIELVPVGSTGPDDDGSRAVVRRGDAVVETTVAWSFLDPDDLSHVLAGTSRFSFYPDDRFVRHDHVQIDGTWNVGPSYRVTTFASFTMGAYTQVQPASDDWPTLVVDVFDLLNEYRELDTPWVCAIEPGTRQVALVVRPTGQPGAGPRIYATGDVGEERIELAYDWSRSLATPDGTYDASTMLLFAGSAADACYETASGGIDFLEPPLLAARPDGGALVVDDPGDDDGDGFVEERGVYRAASDGDHVEVRVQDDPRGPLAFEVALGGDGAAGVTVWLDGERIARGADYHAQHDAALGTTTVWIAREMTAGALVRIAGPGGEP